MEYPAFIVPELRRHIDYKVCSTAQATGLNSFDCDDLKQEIVIELFLNWDRHDSSRGNRVTFAKGIVKNTILHFLEKRRALKVSMVKPVLDASVTGTDGEEEEALVDRIAAKGYDRDTMDTNTDVRMVMSALPPKYRKACQLMMAGYEFEEIRKRLGVTDYELNDKMRKRLRRVFARFRKNSEKSSPTGSRSSGISRPPARGGSTAKLGKGISK